MVMEEPAYRRIPFRDRSGYLLDPGNAGHEFLSVRHSASASPWADEDVHLHEASEEFFLLMQGELVFLVCDRLLDLHPGEILMLRPNVPHAIARGSGLIEHFGFRAPALPDRRSLGPLPPDIPGPIDFAPRELRAEWGYRAPLYDSINKNSWSIGYGKARFPSSRLVFAFLDFQSHEEANEGIGTRHRLHLHRESWEYYVVLQGAKTLLIDGQAVTVTPGEMLEVRPGVRHALLGRQAPYLGFTFRVPALDDKVEF
jgi:mannose-6-phosphate isomerase-like protein (cupin superfamily)